MPNIHEDLTSQIDDVTDTFTTINDITDGVLGVHNGQVINTGDVTVLTANSFQLAFVPLKTSPTGTDTLSVFINPVVFNITAQIDGIKTDFKEDGSDTGDGEFVAIYNGQVLTQDTLTLNGDCFRLPFVPMSGDTLEYFRVQNIKVLGTSFIADGKVKDFSVLGKVTTLQVKGVAVQNQAAGSINFENTLAGVVTVENKIKGVVEV